MEFTLIKVNTETTKEKLKSNLNDAHEVSFQKAHEVGFQKTHCQVKFFLKHVGFIYQIPLTIDILVDIKKGKVNIL